MEILKEWHGLYKYYYKNLKFLPKYLPIENSDTTFQSWKSSSNNLFI